MEIIIKPEEENDHRTVEELTREAFWNIHVPGCDEHLLIHNLRKAKEFISELDFVAIKGNKIIGNIAYAKSKVKNGDLEYDVLTFGPISVLPEYQNNGVGSRLINYTVKLARETGHSAIIIYGDPEYYNRFGFIESKHYKITSKDKKYPAALLVLELYPGALEGIEGIFDEGEAYNIDKNELEVFDKSFTKREKGYSKTQDRFNELLNKYV